MRSPLNLRGFTFLIRQKKVRGAPGMFGRRTTLTDTPIGGPAPISYSPNNRKIRSKLSSRRSVDFGLWSVSPNIRRSFLRLPACLSVPSHSLALDEDLLSPRLIPYAGGRPIPPQSVPDAGNPGPRLSLAGKPLACRYLMLSPSSAHDYYANVSLGSRVGASNKHPGNESALFVGACFWGNTEVRRARA